jgi:hypothetical protein
MFAKKTGLGFGEKGVSPVNEKGPTFAGPFVLFKWQRIE